MGYKLKYNKNLDEHEALKLLASKIMRIPYYNLKNLDNGTTDAVFSFSNEDLNELFKNRNLKNKRVATVGSSGDQLLYSILKGCRDVTLIDANPYTQPYVELKLAAIKNLSYEEFLDYFKYENILNHKYYAKISHDLSDYSKRFWDEILLNIDSDKGYLQMVLFKIFQSVSTYGDFASTMNAMEYCNNKKQYNNLKKALDGDVNIEFIQSSLDQFHEKLKGRYDLILLSNICDYVDRKMFIDEVRKLKYFNLKQFGEMQILYDFNSGLFIPELKEALNKMFLFRKVRVKPCRDVRPADYWYYGKRIRERTEKPCNIVYL